MDREEILDSFKASGSADVKFSAEMFQHEKIKQEENFDGWDAAAWIINYLEYFTPTVSGVYIAIVFSSSQPVCYHIFFNISQ